MKKMYDMKEKYLFEKDDFYLSCTKISGKKIKDVIGFVRNEYDEPSFQISAIIFEDNTKQRIEGEHDFPYLIDLDDETFKIIERINEEEQNKNKKMS